MHTYTHTWATLLAPGAKAAKVLVPAEERAVVPVTSMCKGRIRNRSQVAFPPLLTPLGELCCQALPLSHHTTLSPVQSGSRASWGARGVLARSPEKQEAWDLPSFSCPTVWSMLSPFSYVQLFVTL